MGVEFQPTDQQTANGTAGHQRVQIVTTGDVASRIDGFQNKKTSAGNLPATVLLNRLNVNGGGGTVVPVSSSSSPSSPQPGQQQSVLSALSSTSHMKRSQVIHSIM